MADVAPITHVDELLHTRLKVDLLMLVQLAPAGIAGGVNMADQVLVLLEPADQIAVHGLHVVQVE